MKTIGYTIGRTNNGTPYTTYEEATLQGWQPQRYVGFAAGPVVDRVARTAEDRQ